MSDNQDIAIADASRPETVRRPLLLRSRALLPFSLVLLSLLSLAGLHLLANHKTASLRNRISTVTEPSRALVTEIQSDMALETAAARGYVLAGGIQSAAIRVNAKQARSSGVAIDVEDNGAGISPEQQEWAVSLHSGFPQMPSVTKWSHPHQPKTNQEQ